MKIKFNKEFKDFVIKQNFAEDFEKEIGDINGIFEVDEAYYEVGGDWIILNKKGTLESIAHSDATIIEE